MGQAPHILGIRHHGPGSAHAVLDALDGIRPATVLIEGPVDGTELLPLLAKDDMRPPVALLAYGADDPAHAFFWPFAEYSPEYQAARWALARGATLSFIDLPSGARPPRGAAAASESDETAAVQPTDATRPKDPIGALASAAGYEDGESWWRDVIEENPAPGPVFAAIADAMSALRPDDEPIEAIEAAREAHMRLEIARAVKEAQGPVAVICGAWHAPVLSRKVAASADRELIKALEKRRMRMTWAPWTTPRLAFESGYGAGVAAPGWQQHLWEEKSRASAAWLAKIARALRADGYLVSTASVIETMRLARALAALRGRPQPGFEELREAAIACLCHGERAMWLTIARPLLLGDGVGAIPEDTPLAPLLEDLQREQKRLRLKPEALERELALDLRSESGLDRSTLLHRLLILGVAWGKLNDPGRSRGTFRERWVLRWEPEFSVRLIENLLHGPTIAEAAAAKLAGEIAAATTLSALADAVLSALTAQLTSAAVRGVAAISARAGATSDCLELLAALSPIAVTLRYGSARAIDVGALAGLFETIAVEGALALPHAARGLDTDAAAELRRIVHAANDAIDLIEPSADVAAAWRQALEAMVADNMTSPLIAGAAARLLYEASVIDASAAADLLNRMLSPGKAVAEAAAFFEGFFDGGGERLIHDESLRGAVDAWMAGLVDGAFVEILPLFRRVFSSLDAMQRRRLLDAALGRAAGGLGGLVIAPQADKTWARRLGSIETFLPFVGGGDGR